MAINSPRIIPFEKTTSCFSLQPLEGSHPSEETCSNRLSGLLQVLFTFQIKGNMIVNSNSVMPRHFVENFEVSVTSDLASYNLQSKHGSSLNFPRLSRKRSGRSFQYAHTVWYWKIILICDINSSLSRRKARRIVQNTEDGLIVSSFGAWSNVLCINLSSFLTVSVLLLQRHRIHVQGLSIIVVPGVFCLQEGHGIC